MEARLGEANQALEEQTLRAPCAGTVLRVLVAPGDLIGAPVKGAAIQFAPAGPRIVRAEVDQAFAARVAAGQTAAIEDDVRSGVAWTGRVVRVSDWYTQRRLVSDEALQTKDVRTLECIVAVDSEAAAPLRIGCSASGSGWSREGGTTQALAWRTVDFSEPRLRRRPFHGRVVRPTAVLKPTEVLEG